MRTTIILLTCCALAPAAVAAAPSGPELDEVPGPAIDRDHMPEPATWPVARYQRPLRLMAILSKGESAAAYQRIARRLRATLELRYLAAGDDRYHVNDKWIEPSGDPTMEELIAESRMIAFRSIEPVDGRWPCDVLFCHHELDVPGLQESLLRFLNSGGVLVVCGNVYPSPESRLGQLWPAKATSHNSWMTGGARRSGGWELAGVPVQHLCGHTWIPLAAATDGAVALATGESGAMFLRRVGRGSLLFVPTGPISRRYDAVAKLSRRFDHDEIWLRAWDQVLYSLVPDDSAPGALPACVDLQPGAPQALPAGKYALPMKIINRGHTGPLVMATHVTTPTGRVVYTRVEPLDLAPGRDKSAELHVPVPADWGEGLYPVYLTLSDPKARLMLHQAMELIPVTGTLALTLESEQRGYRLGEDARLTLTASARAPWNGSLRLGIYDFRGRLLGVQQQPARLTLQKQQISLTWPVTDHGVRVDTYWAEVAAVADGKEFGRAATRFYKYEPWSMRNEYQWSTWAGMACGPPSLVPMGMRLMAHAGMNALGYPGRSELHYAAERWGWRYYNEGIGMNTFSPVIEYENEVEIEAALVQETQRATQNPDLTSAAFVLGSVGEEAGFKHGWGTRYYWDTPVAPEKACKALHWFLRQKYPDLAQLNAAWHTAYRSWDEVKLTKEFSARGAVKLDADGWAHPKQSPICQGITAVSVAPYLDTAKFYDWYYDKIVDVARRILRRQINPVTQAMSSAPTIGSARYDVRLSGPSCWNESQWFSVNDGPEPGYGLIWGHFDWSVMTDNMFWGFLLTRGGHNNYWVDIPLMFNNDLTHTRASFAMRRWTHRLAGHERIILDSRPMQSEVGLLGPNGQSLSLKPANMVTSLQVALNQGGFGLADADCLTDDGLRRCKLVFAVGRQAVSPAEAEKLDAYVTSGGTLVLAGHFATQTPLGVAQPVVPGCGLAEKWGIHTVPQHDDDSRERLPIALDGVDESLRGFTMSGEKAFRQQVQHQGWTVAAAYEDGTPALLMRTLGKGRLVFLNAVYQSHWYIQWVTPTGPERQGFYRLVEWLCAQAGVRRSLRLDGDLNQTLHVAIKQFTDPTGRISYVIARTNGEVPWTSSTLNWLGPQKACYDVLGADPGCPAPQLGRQVVLSLQPGAGRLLAFVPAPLGAIRVTAPAEPLIAGHALRLKIDLLDCSGNAVPGSFPLELRVHGPQGEIAGLHRSFSAESGAEVSVSTALTDPPGDWTISVSDGISGLCGTARLRATDDASVAVAPGFVPWGQPSEQIEPAAMTDRQFVDRLLRLAAMYREDHSARGWMTKQYLGYHYDFFPGTRHDLLRPLGEVDWLPFVPALRRALSDGRTFLLTGEDLGVHPGSGLSTCALCDGRQMQAIAAALEGARWSAITPDGDTLAATLGAGRMILCRESIDAAGNTNPELARWQQRFLAELDAKVEQSVAPPDLHKLLAWWTGAESMVSGPRTVTWLAGNYRETTLALDPKSPLGQTFSFTLPPTGKVARMEAAVVTTGAGEVRFDVGCDGQSDGKLLARPDATEPAVVQTWTDTANRYLDWAAAQHTGPYRDGSGWRIIPVRVTASEKAEVTISRPSVVVE